MVVVVWLWLCGCGCVVVVVVVVVVMAVSVSVSVTEIVAGIVCRFRDDRTTVREACSAGQGDWTV